MRLVRGTRLGPYEILAPLGEGGMGEVYRARDTRLDRTVAVKVLPARLTNDPQFRERFEREARTVSSLNHPNICVLHDIGEENGTGFLVMEYLEGETLAARIERGAIPIAETLRIGIEICGALDAAHRRGIVHRDIKPGNIILTRTGAKLLDFGLAKIQSKAAIAEQASTRTISREGIAGTFQYMSPEQLEGKEADFRSDIFGFGATLYEALTGKRAFQGGSYAGVVTSIMSVEPAPVSTHQPKASSALDRLVNRCVAKDPDERWQTARDLRQELSWVQDGLNPYGSSSAPATGKPRGRWAWIVTAVFALAALVMVILLFRTPKPPARPLRLTVNAPDENVLVGRPNISPDGEKILFAAIAGVEARTYLYNLVSGETQTITGINDTNVAWSRDSRSFLGHAGRSLARFTMAGGAPQPIALPFQTDALSWGPQGIVASDGTQLQWFQPDGSGVRALGNPGQAVVYPTLIPGTQSLIYNDQPSFSGASASVHWASIEQKTDRTLFVADSSAIYAEPGYILFVRGNTLMARRFDGAKGELRGEAIPLIDGVPTGSGLGWFSSSANGVLVYRAGNAISNHQMLWFDRMGKQIGTLGNTANYGNPSLSPDGKKLAVCIREAGSGRDIWVFDLDRGTSARLTFDPKDDINPVWSPDGSRIVFSSDRKGKRDLYTKSSSGTGEEELLLESGLNKNAEDWSRDGRFLLSNQLAPTSSNDIWTFSFDGRKVQPFLQTRFNEEQARFSPDGKWVAYRSIESGRYEVYIQPFAGAGARGKWVVSSGGGMEPQWRADGKELFYATSTAPGSQTRIMAVDITQKDGAIVVGTPHILFETRLGTGGRSRWAVTADGKKFLMLVPLKQRPVTSLNVIINWPSLLAK